MAHHFDCDPTMLQTPPTFTPLMAPQDHADPLTFVFHGGRLLVREHDLALPDAAALDRVKLDPANVQPVGMLGERYCQAGWLESDALPEGYAWRGLRSLLVRTRRVAAGPGRTRGADRGMGAHPPLLRRLRPSDGARGA